MATLTKEQIAEAKAARSASDAQPGQRTGKSSAMAVNEQTAQSTQMTVDESSKAGTQLAIAEMKSFAVGYGEASQKLSGVLETELDKIRRGRHAAIASASVPNVEADVEDFLTGFEQDLQSLLAPAD